MRSTTERIKLAKKQADEIKKQRNEKDIDWQSSRAIRLALL